MGAKGDDGTGGYSSQVVRHTGDARVGRGRGGGREGILSLVVTIGITSNPPLTRVVGDCK